jgi:hypothetical protein
VEGVAESKCSEQYLSGELPDGDSRAKTGEVLANVALSSGRHRQRPAVRP